MRNLGLLILWLLLPVVAWSASKSCELKNTEVIYESITQHGDQTLIRHPRLVVEKKEAWFVSGFIERDLEGYGNGICKLAGFKTGKILKYSDPTGIDLAVLIDYDGNIRNIWEGPIPVMPTNEIARLVSCYR